MLGKLFQYEFKNTARVMLASYLVMIAVTILDMITLNDSLFPWASNSVFNRFRVTFIILYVLTTIALFIVTYVYVCHHFYKTMYSDQGYLTHTLPVNPLTTFHVKLLTAFTWILVSTIVLFVSFIALMESVTGGVFLKTLTASDWRLFKEVFEDALGMPSVLTMFYFIASAIFSLLHLLLLVYASASVGQLFTTNKVGLSIVAGIVFYFAEQIISSVLMVIFGFSYIMAADNYSLGLMPIMTMSLIVTVLFDLLFYGINVVIIKKHINLD